ncbi:MAG: EAL domain-containing protein [Leptonema illini]|uniref:EAL domain-containing protein n=1 Tax=Leptonema illini TaxID=183 RepID=A0A833LWY4_9LEPT|nr:MAG: EAL domain-containing protein [Leptonema illini]
MAGIRRRLLRLLMRLYQRRRLLSLGLLFTALYIGGFVVAFHRFGTALILLSFLPNAVLSLGGKRYGILAGTLIGAINTIFIVVYLPEITGELFYSSVLIDFLVQILIGLGVGHLRDSQRTMERIVRQRQHAINRVRHMALHDSLTGLANHRLLYEELDLEIRHAQRDKKRLAVLFIDVDDFKHVNASLGYHEGDELLKHTGKAILDSLRLSDTVARFGGDEFIAVLPGIGSAEDILPVTNRLLKAIQTASATVRLSISGGIAVYPEDGTTPTDLVRNATDAMFVAKENGKGLFRYWKEVQHETIRHRLAVEAALQSALLRDEFRLFYQPILHITDGHIIGAEALLRWTSPELGEISPAVFIPVAEKSGVIREIGLWVLDRVLSDLKALNVKGQALEFIAVNVSTVQLIDPHFPAQALQKIRSAGIDPSRLEFEVTETGIALQGNPAGLLAPIKKIGVRIALDDFGTGNSSLRYLSDLPIDVLKIDGSFVKKTMVDSKAAVITHTIVSLALLLNLNIVAECIENEEERQTMYFMGVDRMQGFLFSPAVTFEEFSAMLSRNHSLPPIETIDSHP